MTKGILLDGIKYTTQDLDNAWSNSRWETPSDFIARLISEHDYIAVWNDETGEYDEVSTGNPYRKCTGCCICTDIAEVNQQSAVFSIARTRARGFAKFEVGHIGKFHEMGLSLSEMAIVMDCKDSRILAEIHRLIEDFGALYTFNYLSLWEVSEQVFREWTGITAHSLRKEREAAKVLKGAI